MLYSYQGSDASQEHVYKMLKRYIRIQKDKFPGKYQEKDVAELLATLKKGNCNGYIGLWIFRILQKNEKKHFDLIDAIATWDGKESTLEADKALATKFEEFLSHIMWLQKDFKLLFSNLPQHHLDTNLSYLTGASGLCRHFNFSLVMTEAELKNIVSKLIDSSLPIVIRCEDHVIAFCLESENVRFYDSIGKKGSVIIPSDQIIAKIKNALFTSMFSFQTHMKLMIDVFGTKDDTVSFPLPAELTKQILRNRKAGSKPAQDGTTDAHMAVIANNGQILTALVDEGISVVERDAKGLTPLHLGAIHGYTEVIEILLRHFENIDLRCAAGKTPMDYAIANHKWDAALLLISKGANLYNEDRNGLSPLKFIIMDNQVEFIRKLFELNHLNNDFINSKKLLHFAIKHKCFKVASLLLEKGADINLQDGFGSTPLHELLRNPDKPFMKDMLQKGPNLTLGNFMGTTPIHMAAKLGNVDFIEAINGHIGLNLPDLMGKMPIHIAVLEKNEAMVRALIKAGADIEARDGQGNKAIDLAMKNNFVDLINLLAPNRRSIFTMGLR